MSESLHLTLSIVALVCMAAGTLLSLYARRRYGSERAPKGISFHPRDWRLVYLTRDWFTEKKGFWLYLAGIEILCAGPLILIIAAVLRS